VCVCVRARVCVCVCVCTFPDLCFSRSKVTCTLHEVLCTLVIFVLLVCRVDRGETRAEAEETTDEGSIIIGQYPF